MSTQHHYDKFIVQSLVGNASWSSTTRAGKYFHVGTIPNRRNHTYVSDLRVMVAGNSSGLGFRPVAIYARRARKPLLRNLTDDPQVTSWEMLGTNLSVKLNDDGTAWTTEAQRLLLMDRKDFNILGIGIDDLIDAYVQTVLSVIAIDKMCQRLMPEREMEVEVERPLVPPMILEALPKPAIPLAESTKGTNDEDGSAASLAAKEDQPALSLPSSPLQGPSSPGLNPDDHYLISAIETAQATTEDLEGALTQLAISQGHRVETRPDGRTVVIQKVKKMQPVFDAELFEALNPDKVLLEEIMM
jgi:hypothetical protein